MSKEFIGKDIKNGYITVIVILVFAVIGLGGYIGYEHFLKDKSYELTYSKAEEYIKKIKIYNNYFYSNFLYSEQQEITNEELLTFAYQIINLTEDVTVEKVEDVLHEYFGKNVKFKHEDIRCYAGEIIYEYDEEKGYIKKEHSGHGGPAILTTEVYYVSSEVKGNKVKFVTKNVFERLCGDTCGPADAYYATVEDSIDQKNPVYEDKYGNVGITSYNEKEIFEKVPETTYNFIIEENGNFYLDSVSISK